MMCETEKAQEREELDMTVNKAIKEAGNTEMNHQIRDIELSLIDMNPDNEYIFGYTDIDFLANEIKEGGFHGAIEVFAKPDGRYEINAGHRRYLACRQLGYETIPCIVNDYKDSSAAAEQLIMSNIHHRDLTPLRRARAIDYYDKNVMVKRKVDYQGRKRAALAEKFNMGEGSIQRYLAILNLIPELQELCDTKDFPWTYYIPLAKEDAEVQRMVYRSLLESAPEGNIKELSRKQVEWQLDSIRLKREREAENAKKIAEKNKVMGSAGSSEEISAEPESDGFISFWQMPDDGDGINAYTDYGASGADAGGGYYAAADQDTDEMTVSPVEEIESLIERIKFCVADISNISDRGVVVSMLDDLIKEIKKTWNQTERY